MRLQVRVVQDATDRALADVEAEAAEMGREQAA